MQPYKILNYFVIISLLLMSFSCKKEEEKKIGGGEGQPTDKGGVEVNGYWFIFEEVSSSVKDTFKYGNFNTETAQYDTIRLDRPINSLDNNNYTATIYFFDDQQDVTTYIRNNGFDYIVCYRDFNTDHLRLQERGKDTNGNTLGLDSDWYTEGGANQEVQGNVRITLNYQQNKENLCDAGVRIFDVTVPYKLY